MARVFGVLLTDEGLAELTPALKDYLSEGPIGKYLYAKEAHLDGTYFHVVAESSNRDGSTFEADIHIPHRFVKIVIAATDRKRIGFA
jgi:hypothetical protein